MILILIDAYMKFFSQHIKYLKDNPEGYWFKAKLYGWGWTPITWQGWAVLLVYIFFITLFARNSDETSSIREGIFTFILPTVLLSFALIWICYKKGEKPRWQWGPPNDKNRRK